jgi:hypothetical protein
MYWQTTNLKLGFVIYVSTYLAFIAAASIAKRQQIISANVWRLLAVNRKHFEIITRKPT